MEGRARKQRLRPPKPASVEGFGGSRDPMLCTQGVRGSNPLVSTKPHLQRGSRFHPLQNPPKKQRLTPSRRPSTRFLLSKRVAGCTEATLGIYVWWLRRLIADIPHVTPRGEPQTPDRTDGGGGPNPPAKRLGWRLMARLGHNLLKTAYFSPIVPLDDFEASCSELPAQGEIGYACCPRHHRGDLGSKSRQGIRACADKRQVAVRSPHVRYTDRLGGGRERAGWSFPHGCRAIDRAHQRRRGSLVGRYAASPSWTTDRLQRLCDPSTYRTPRVDQDARRFTDCGSRETRQRCALPYA